jgi:RNA polymerase sigma-70 factor (ECF subfamily)
LNLFEFGAFHLASTVVVPAHLELVGAARHHALGAWDNLLKRHQLALYTYVIELVRDKATAMDIVQETFASAVQHIANLREDSRFASWLFGIAHQKCVQHWRRSQRTAAVFSSDVAEDTTGDWPDTEGFDPRTALLRREQADTFFALVDQLPPAQRSALLLHVLEDFSIEDIAEITGAAEGTVKSRLHYAKRALRQLVEAAK